MKSMFFLNGLFCGFALWCCLRADPEMKTNTRLRIEEKLFLSGATKINPDEYVVDNQFRFTLSYDADRLSTVRVGLLPGAKDIHYEEDRLCCMSLSTYNKLLNIINELQSLGAFKKDDPLKVIPTSGWIRRKAEYQNALVVISEKNCQHPDPQLGCGIDRFSVYYWMRICGKIESKQFRRIPIGDPPMIEYTVLIDGKELSVSKTDYNRLQKGMDVSFRIIVDGNQAEIISVKTRRRDR